MYVKMAILNLIFKGTTKWIFFINKYFDQNFTEKNINLIEITVQTFINTNSI